ncbi:MAG: hypothetical protein E7I93_13320 [Clostridium perfringens]|uniref:hypothetical protein n=1 Tax=Clostridium perfringens TaxID=1502 RepID=UPI0024BD0AC2|nr:hypothetical protein [Clostridium perfringens]MDM0454571.1 hypothetical protein [Clostridium perfringens]MDU4473280.1 hypothetical protein [Clostridium perfringens]
MRKNIKSLIGEIFKKGIIVGVCASTLFLAGCVEGNKESLDKHKGDKVEDTSEKEKEKDDLKEVLISEDEKRESDKRTLSLASEIINESLNEIKVISRDNTSGKLEDIEFELSSVMEKENKRLENLVEKIYDEALLSTFKDYIKGNELRAKYYKGRSENYMEVMDYGSESDEIISISICKMVDEYGLVINEENMDFYEDCREKVAYLDKKEDYKKIAEELISKGEFKVELEEDEVIKSCFGDDKEVFKYSKVVENTSGINLDYIAFSINGKLENGKIEEFPKVLIGFNSGKSEEIVFYNTNKYKSIEFEVEWVSFN